jgi:hypothetical protein
VRRRIAGGIIVTKWKPPHTVFALRLAIALVVALVGADFEFVPNDGWTWDE